MQGREGFGKCLQSGRWLACLLLLLLQLTTSCSSTQDHPQRTADARNPASKNPPAVQSPESGEDFTNEARLLYRIVACTDSESLPPDIDRAVVEEHCRQFKPRIEYYRKQYLAQAAPFLAKVKTGDVPSTVVYPFGGGDLLSALTTYPDAEDITTLSLELAGDPRRIRTLRGDGLRESLGAIRGSFGGLLLQNNSTSESLKKVQRGDIPGQIAAFLIGMAVHGFEPVGLHYFHLEPNGDLHYLSSAEIHKLEAKTAGPRNIDWTAPDFSEAFSNSELLFRRAGSNEKLRVHRHIGANLADGVLRSNPSILAHLSRKGSIAAMTKAASYLLWNPGFTKIRDFLLEHAAIMIADSTGIPASVAEMHGFSIDTYGRFEESLLPASPAYNEEFRNLWNSQPYRPLPFRYGYWDAKANYHMMVMHKTKHL